ncbi:Hypothetical predicted protein [Lecanosticta acicola]|uniref:DUF7053 domain-containing protein n=1 Tax=Lecanosticta acicola TaxID=111012 RepID=A0AAI9E3J6_9PEZI|nr:Hypothetical predicted protein [Lecanosticta acicola]
MFEIDFQHSSQTPLPPNLPVDQGIRILHDFETVIRLSPDCRGCKPIPPPNGKKKPATTNTTSVDGTPQEQAQMQHYEVEDDLPFIPKKLWAGGVKYVADFFPTTEGCDITVHAPGGFTSTNHWRILRETIPEDEEMQLERVRTKDLMHAETTGGTGGWYVQIVSDARCSRTFAGFVKGFLKNSHQQLQRAFIEKLQATRAQQGSRRPTIGRRRSSEL